jgi:hypothetical protein
MEPMMISELSRHRAQLSDKVLQLTQRAEAFLWYASRPNSKRQADACVYGRKN